MASLPAWPTDSMSRPAPFTVLQPVTRTLANRARRIARKLVIFLPLRSGAKWPGTLRGGGGNAGRANVAEQRCGGAMTAARMGNDQRSEEHTSELQSLMRISYAVFCLKNKKE